MTWLSPLNKPTALRNIAARPWPVTLNWVPFVDAAVVTATDQAAEIAASSFRSIC